MVNVADDIEESRSERNFRKREDFYKKLKSINFNFAANNLDLKTFIQKFSSQLNVLNNVCKNTIPSCKGRATIKHLTLICEAAEKLHQSTTNLFASDGFINSGKAILTAMNKVVALSDTLTKTRKARFPSLFNPSTLDYDLTRDKLKEMSSQLNQCLGIFIALTNEFVVDCLLKKLKDTKNLDTLIRERKLKPGFYVVTFEWHGNRYVIGLSTKEVDAWVLAQLSDNLKRFNKFKNFNKKIEDLNAIALQIDIEHGQELVTCDCCKNKFDIRNSEHWAGINEGCEHRICIDCLKHIASKRLGAYKCPICNRHLNKQWVLDRIKRAE